MTSSTNEQRRLERIAAARAALAERYVSDPEGVASFNLRMSRIAKAAKRERQRVARLALGSAETKPAEPDNVRPAGMSRSDWKIERQRRMDEYQRAMTVWKRERENADKPDKRRPTREQMHRAVYAETDVNDYIGGKLVKIGHAYRRQPRFETIEGLSVEQIAALRRYRRAFDTSEMSPTKSVLDIGPGGGAGGSDAALSRLEALAFADIVVQRIEAAVPGHLVAGLRAIALHDDDFSTVALARYGSASGQRRSRIRQEFISAVDALVSASSPPQRFATVPDAVPPAPSDPVSVHPAFLDERGIMRPTNEIIEIILASLRMDEQIAQL